MENTADMLGFDVSLHGFSRPFVSTTDFTVNDVDDRDQSADYSSAQQHLPSLIKSRFIEYLSARNKPNIENYWVNEKLMGAYRTRATNHWNLGSDDNGVLSVVHPAASIVYFLVNIALQEKLPTPQELLKTSFMASTFERGEELALYTQFASIYSLIKDLVKTKPSIYTADDGAIVIDCSAKQDRMVCVLRHNYAHLMANCSGEITDITFKDMGYSVNAVCESLTSLIK